MICKICNLENEEGAKFCGGCGSELVGDSDGVGSNKVFYRPHQGDSEPFIIFSIIGNTVFFKGIQKEDKEKFEAKLLNNETQKFKSFEFNEGEVSLAKNLLVIKSYSGKVLSLNYDDVDLATETYGSLIKTLHTVHKGERNIQNKEKLARAMPSLLTAVGLLFLTCIMPYLIEQSYYTGRVYLVLYPFVKLGTKWSLVILGGCTLLFVCGGFMKLTEAVRVKFATIKN